MTEDTVSLGGTEWTVVELDGDPLELAVDERAPMLVFDLEESRVAGTSGVDRLMGTFALSEDELRFGRLATTLMAGPDGSMARERRLLDALARVTGYHLDGRSLALTAGGVVAVRLSV